MKLFLDANVLFTAAYSDGGISRSLFNLAADERCSLFTSAFAVEEARRNLALKAPTKLSSLDHLVAKLTVVPEPLPDKVQWALNLPLATKDAPIMAAAATCAADILVTGDLRDFGHLFSKKFGSLRVLRPREALEEVLSKGAASSSGDE